MATPASADAGSLIRLSDHRLGYQGKPVLRAISLSINVGERIALVGESGAGKSTLLRLLRSRLAADVAWCPQQLGLVEPLSVFHNIYMGRLNRYGVLANLRNLISPDPRRLAEIRPLTEALGISDLLHRSVDRLSGGQQQRTALGRALYQQSSLFIGDEPVSSVDEYQADQLLGLINRRHRTVIVALHDQQLALNHCQRIIGLKGGELVLDAPTSEVQPGQLAALYRR